MRILVVDDSEFARRRIKAVLETGGHEIVEAQSGPDALKLLKETEPQVATVDLLMPGMDGIDLLGRLRKLRPHLPVIIVSADVQLATRREVLAAGATRFVAKTGLDALLSAVNQAGAGGLIPFLLSAAEKDAFTEVMNIAMEQAAEALNALLARRVLLKVPEVELMTASGLTAFFQEELVQVGVTMRQRFSGQLNGVAAMVFSSAHAMYLVRTLVGIQHELSRLSAAEQSVLTEMGNIVLNAAIAVLADQLGARVGLSLPDLTLNQEGSAAARLLLGSVAGADKAFVLVSRLTIGDAEMISYLILLMPEEDAQRLLARMNP